MARREVSTSFLFLKIQTMKKYILLLMWISVGCRKADIPDNPVTPPAVTPTVTLAKGADISWVTQMENAGVKFYNASGTAEDCYKILKDLGVNAIRLRVWVNPSNGWCNTTDMVAKAVRAKNMGMKLLIDFHYSDSWADPGKQNKPAAWVGQDINGLQTSVYNHTTSVLTALKNAGITPEWVQVGNETNDGMLWPEGKASVNMAGFAALVNAGYNAVKASDAGIKVMVHVSNGYDNALFRWLFDGLKNNGGKWDIVGMSLYPSATNWSAYNSQCLANMNDMVARYNKEVMVCEVGMPVAEASACNSFLTDLLVKTAAVNGGKGLGVFYWEPESYNGWQGYQLGAFDNSGKPTIALNAFR
jgi:arabinogalactan endo-1,4-beta-galactosidase